MDNSLISVVVPIYKVEKFLSKCIESIIGQTYSNLEIILVDDGSPDSCPQICDAFAQEDSRIKVIHKENGGLSDARNAGIDIAEGDYFVFVDSDDFVSCHMIEKLYDRMLCDGSDLAICNIDFVDESGASLPMSTIRIEDCVVDEKQFWSTLYSNNYTYCVVAWNKLYKRELFEGVRSEKGRLHEDEYILHQIVSKCGKISFLKEKCYFYLQRPNSIMRSGFSVRNLDFSEAVIQRSLYFKQKGQQHLAESVLLKSIRVMRRGYRELDRKDRRIKNRIQEIHREYRSAYLKLLKGKPSLLFVLKGMTFFIGIRFYNVTHYKRGM